MILQMILFFYLPAVASDNYLQYSLIQAEFIVDEEMENWSEWNQIFLYKVYFKQGDFSTGLSKQHTFAAVDSVKYLDLTKN